MSERTKKQKQVQKKELTFKYIHPDRLRDCYVNGAWGGFTPRKEIHMHLYSERHPIPKASIHKINDDGTFDKKGENELGADVVRLIQSSVVMNIETAISLRNWLTMMINSVNEKKEEVVVEDENNGL